ncbi:MAG TPA: cation diffusion facilitator family transporter [Candidatus Dormibacteraeota bacterium]
MTTAYVQHSHGAGAHSHRVGPGADVRRLWTALALILGFMATEVVAGLLFHSLALLSDAGHMLTDAGALILSIVVLRLAARPPAGDLTYGLKRTEILAGLANGITLLVIGALIVFEAIHRLFNPAPAGGLPIVVVAVIGIGVNLLATWQLAMAEQKSLNIRGSYQHILTDLYAFIATAIAGAVILLTGFLRADPLASLLIAALMFRAAYGLIREAGGVLLEAAPAGMDADEVVESIVQHPLVASVHDFHLWEITSGEAALSAHVLCREGEDCHTLRRDIEEALTKRFEIKHTTLQVDHLTDGFVPAESIKAAKEDQPDHG